MSTAYALAYRLGIMPWEKAGEGGREQLSSLFDREQAGVPAAGPAADRALGRALDVGCGRGAHTVELASRGWDAVGLDLVPRAVQLARQRAAEAGSAAEFVTGDVTDLPPGVGTGYRFVLDLGCYQGLPWAQRARFGEQITAVTDAGATLLVLAFAPGGRFAFPRGSSSQDLLTALPQWSVIDVEQAVTTGMPGPMRARNPQFFRLRRSGG